MRVLSQTDLAYIAGIMDSEGTFGVYYSKTNKGTYRYKRFAAKASVVNTNRAILQWLLKMFGGSIHPKTLTYKNCKPTWEWHISGYNAEKFIPAILPYMKMKREQAQIFMEMRRRQRTNVHKPLLASEMSERFALIARLKSLNKQGVR